MTRSARLAAAFAAALLALWPAVPAAAAPAPQAATCSGVWVVVGGQGTRCATSFGTGKQALSSAGFSVAEKSAGFLCQINGSPATCTVSTSAYWSYWHASKNANGTWGAWQYSSLGYTSYKPKQGDAEGWAFGNGKTPPGAPPASAPATSAPAPAPTTKAPTTQAPAPTTKAPATTKAPGAPTTTVQGGATQGGATTQAAGSGSVSAAPDATVAPDASASAVAASGPGTGEATAVATDLPAPVASSTALDNAAPASSGSAVGALATLGVVVAGSSALGGWWLVKGRHR